MGIPLILGEKLHLYILTGERKRSPKMISQVMECPGDDTFIIAMPMLEGRLVPVQTDREIRLAYYRENGVYEFTERVVGRSGGKLPSLRVKALSGPVKSQRREYYRLNTVLPVNIVIEPEGEEDAPRVVKCLTLDISAGGMRLASGRGMKKDSPLTCELKLPGKVLTLKATVIRSTAVYNEEYSYEIGVQFVELDEKVRKEIIGYIFEQQIRMIQKGLMR